MPKDGEAATLQLDAKIMLNLILDEIRELRASQASEIASLHSRLAKIEESIFHLPERVKKPESRNWRICYLPLRNF